MANTRSCSNILFKSVIYYFSHSSHTYHKTDSLGGHLFLTRYGTRRQALERSLRMNANVSAVDYTFTGPFTVFLTHGVVASIA